MKKFKESKILKYTLWCLPTLAFMMLISVCNFATTPMYITKTSINLELPYEENNAEFYKKDLKTLFAKFPSENEKIKWCEKRYSCVVLSEMGYHEARGERDFGIVSVMYVSKNRAESDHSIFRKQKTIPAVIYAKNQFSYINDGSKARGMKNKKQKNRTMILAYDVLNGLISDTTNKSLYYHTTRVSPSWASVYSYTYSVSSHHFYKHKG